MIIPSQKKFTDTKNNNKQNKNKIVKRIVFPLYLEFNIYISKHKKT